MCRVWQKGNLKNFSPWRKRWSYRFLVSVFPMSGVKEAINWIGLNYWIISYHHMLNSHFPPLLVLHFNDLKKNTTWILCSKESSCRKMHLFLLWEYVTEKQTWVWFRLPLLSRCASKGKALSLGLSFLTGKINEYRLLNLWGPFSTRILWSKG